MTVLIIAAHPDDEVLGCGGTIPIMAERGENVYIAILGEGITSRFENNDAEVSHLVGQLKNKSLQVAKTLGAKDFFNYSFPDNKFDTIPLLDIVKPIEQLIKRIGPSKIYTHFGGDLNIDHKITFRAVMTATRPFKGSSVKEIYSFEVASSTEWSFGQFDSIFNPNVFVDISSTFEQKINALKFYDCEIRDFPHPRSEKALKAYSEKWGSQVGLPAAEVFQLIRWIR